MEFLCGAIYIFMLTLIVILFGEFKDAPKHRPTSYFKYLNGSQGDHPDDITSYATTLDIYQSGRFTASERKKEYIRRGKSPSGVVDGEYNDDYLEDGRIYHDDTRDWEADA